MALDFIIFIAILGILSRECLQRKNYSLLAVVGLVTVLGGRSLYRLDRLGPTAESFDRRSEDSLRYERGTTSELPRSTKRVEVDLMSPLITAPAQDTSVSDPRIVIRGTAEPNTKVILYLGIESEKELGSVNVDEYGNWEYIVDETVGLRDGVYHISAISIAPDGRPSPPSSVRTFSIARAPGDIPSSDLSPPSLEETESVYQSVFSKNIDDVTAYNLETVCADWEPESSESDQTVTIDYQAKVDGSPVTGKMVFQRCLINDNVDALGRFLDDNGCSGQISWVIEEVSADDRITAILMHWDYENCGKETTSILARLRRAEETSWKKTDIYVHRSSNRG